MLDPATDKTKRPHTLSTVELIAMVAALSALNALAIDIMLPALPSIGRDFGLTNPNDRQLVVVAYIAMFGLAQLVYGPLADAYGRRSVLVWSLSIYIAGSVLCVLAPNFELFLAARALQGVGAAATRVISIAVVRDLTSGRRMAQVMSMAMTVFMIVPIIAPGVGQLILFVAPWRWIFGALLIYSLAILLWTLLRLPETLAPENRTSFRPRAIAASYGAVLRERQTLGYMLATTFTTGALFSYVASAEQIFVDVYGLGAAFPLAFAAIAITISAGSAVNSYLVMRHGMRRLSHVMTIYFTLLAASGAALMALGVHNFWFFIVLLGAILGVFGMIGGNFNALAMEPVGRVAGSASALFGAATASGGAILGGIIARLFDGTPLPFLTGLAVLGAATLATLFWIERGRLFVDPIAPEGPARIP
jgi:MFS transporter, DHA1 family, multidrug resistance protein